MALRGMIAQTAPARNRRSGAGWVRRVCPPFTSHEATKAHGKAAKPFWVKIKRGKHGAPDRDIRDTIGYLSGILDVCCGF